MKVVQLECPYATMIYCFGLRIAHVHVFLSVAVAVRQRRGWFDRDYGELGSFKPWYGYTLGRLYPDQPEDLQTKFLVNTRNNRNAAFTIDYQQDVKTASPPMNKGLRLLLCLSVSLTLSLSLCLSF